MLVYIFFFVLFVLLACSFWLHNMVYPGQRAGKKNEMKRRQ